MEVMEVTGCQNREYVRNLLLDNWGDSCAVIEFILLMGDFGMSSTLLNVFPFISYLYHKSFHLTLFTFHLFPKFQPNSMKKSTWWKRSKLSKTKNKNESYKNKRRKRKKKRKKLQQQQKQQQQKQQPVKQTNTQSQTRNNNSFYGGDFDYDHDYEDDDECNGDYSQLGTLTKLSSFFLFLIRIISFFSDH